MLAEKGPLLSRNPSNPWDYCGCDTFALGADKKTWETTYNDFTVYLRGTDGAKLPLPKISKAMAEQLGYPYSGKQVIAPSVFGYEVVIQNKRHGTKFTFKMTVGDREVITNNGSLLYYNGETVISAYETGSTESFLFYSPDSTEGPPPGTSKSNNVINIKLQRWEIDRPPPQFRGAADVTVFGGEYGCQNRSLSRPTISGGCTISGGQFFGHKPTQPLRDQLKKTGEPEEICFQIVCTQKDKDKKHDNDKYKSELKTRMDAALIADELKTRMDMIAECEKMIAECEKKKAIRKRMREELDTIDADIEKMEAMISKRSRPTEDDMWPV